jgi:hypothetical protein
LIFEQAEIRRVDNMDTKIIQHIDQGAANMVRAAKALRSKLGQDGELLLIANQVPADALEKLKQIATFDPESLTEKELRQAIEVAVEIFYNPETWIDAAS